MLGHFIAAELKVTEFKDTFCNDEGSYGELSTSYTKKRKNEQNISDLEQACANNDFVSALLQTDRDIHAEELRLCGKEPKEDSFITLSKKYSKRFRDEGTITNDIFQIMLQA